MARSFERDLTQGNLIKQVLYYALPIIAVNILQGLFNSVDVAVLSWFVGSDAVGAVGATGSIINLFIGFFVGIALGASVCVGRCVGKKDKLEAERYVSTSIIFSLISGVFIAIVGIILARTMLIWTKCDAELLDNAELYLKIYFCGMPILMFYNFAAAILRAVGDSKSPLIFLMISGVLNVGLNIFCIKVLNLAVAGVAIATVASQLVSGICCLVLLLKSKGYAKINVKNFKLHIKELKALLYIGVPSGLQKLFYGLSNTIVASAINAFGKVATTGNSIANQVENIIHETTEGFSISAISFVSQNHGAKNYKRLNQSVLTCFGYVFIVGTVLGFVLMFLGKDICRLLLTQDEAVLEIAQIKFNMMAFSYIINGVMNTSANALRGLGKSIIGMITGLTSGCILRIAYIKLVEIIFPGSLSMVYSAYLVCWALGAILNVVLFYVVLNKEKSKNIESIKQLQEAGQ